MAMHIRFGPVEPEPFLDSRSRAAAEHERYRRRQIALDRRYRREIRRSR
jgi:hypothetical protein